MPERVIEIYDDETDEDVELVEIRQKQASKLYKGLHGSNASRPDLQMRKPALSHKRNRHEPLSQSRSNIPLHSSKPNNKSTVTTPTIIEEAEEDDDEREPAPALTKPNSKNALTTTTIIEETDGESEEEGEVKQAPTTLTNKLTNSINMLPYPHNLPTATSLRPLRPILPAPPAHKPTTQEPPPPPRPRPRPASPASPPKPDYPKDKTHCTGIVAWWDDRLGKGLVVESRGTPPPRSFPVALEDISESGYGALVMGSMIEWECEGKKARNVWVWPNTGFVLYADAWDNDAKYLYMRYEKDEDFKLELTL